MFKIQSDNYYGWDTNDITVIKNFKSKWFKNNIKNKNNFIFNREKDYVIFPEIFAHFAKNLCIEKKIPYAIFVQNGYCLNSTSNFKTLEEVYKNAKFILSYSKDISKCMKLAFKNCKKKILKTNISVDINKFKLSKKKVNMITYMPRKLPVHSDNLIFFLRNKLPKSWQLKPLHNLSEKDVYKYLSKSKSFLSFSDTEGLGMPPIEAAIVCCKLIGYCGQVGTEYWRKPIFTEIPHGNIPKFIYEIFKHINHKNLVKQFKSSRKKIANQFSTNQEKKYLIKMINKIKSKK